MSDSQTMPSLTVGPLEPYFKRVESIEDLPTRKFVRWLLTRMVEIDAETSASLYYEDASFNNDTPPTGDHYNELWDANLDEIRGFLDDLGCPPWSE